MELIHGDCLEKMRDIPDKSIDMILCDLPYGSFTACKWDVIIPFEPLWEQYKRIVKDKGAIVLFASQPFTTSLISSNLEMFKYCWYWKKSKPNGWQHSKNKPMTVIEELCVFSKSSIGHVRQLGNKRMQYNPQGVTSVGSKKITAVAHGAMMGARPNQIGKEYEAFTGFPHNMLDYANVTGKQAIHPTQKPVALLEYLIKTYTVEGETVLDNTMGSGSTGVACINTKRNFIGIEKDDKYFEIAKKRITDAIKDNETKLF